MNSHKNIDNAKDQKVFMAQLSVYIWFVVTEYSSYLHEWPVH